MKKYNLSDLSDELIGPISNIVSLSTLLESKLSSQSKSDSDNAKYAEEITATATQFRQTIETLLSDFAIEVDQSQVWIEKIKSNKESLAQSSHSKPISSLPHRYLGKALVVEDDPSNRMNIAASLNAIRLEHDFAVDANSALEALNTKSYSIVFMDYNMPQMNGVQLTKLIRESKNNYSQIPIIAHTNYDSQAARTECLNAGMNDFLPKPAPAKSFEIILSKFLGNADKRSLSSDDCSQSVLGMPQLTLIGYKDSEIKVLIQNFLESVDGKVEEISSAIKEKNHKMVENSSHRFASNLMAMGSKEAQKLSLEIEQLAKQKDFESCANQFVLLKNQIDELKSALQEKLNKVLNTDSSDSFIVSYLFFKKLKNRA